MTESLPELVKEFNEGFCLIDYAKIPKKARERNDYICDQFRKAGRYGIKYLDKAINDNRTNTCESAALILMGIGSDYPVVKEILEKRMMIELEDSVNYRILYALEKLGGSNYDGQFEAAKGAASELKKRLEERIKALHKRDEFQFLSDEEIEGMFEEAFTGIDLESMKKYLKLKDSLKDD